MIESYEEFVDRKIRRVPPTGMFTVPELHPSLFAYQRDLVSWALRRGRAAIFADTGLGKSRMQIEWARHVVERTGRPVLILAPLAVGAQTAREGAAMGIAVALCREAGDVRGGINVTNYERLHHFAPEAFAGVVLDESSIIKNYTAKTLAQLLEAFAPTAWKLCATATPAPNDYTELGNHAEFLGICTRTEMLSEFFVHDGGSTQDWRLKGHARADFWRWVASWAALVRKPSDLGYDDASHALPPLHVTEHVVEATAEQARAQGRLFAEAASGLSEQRSARKATLDERVSRCAALVNAHPNEPWLVWCELNSESEGLADAIADAVEVTGSDDADDKERALLDFAEGRSRVLVSKPSICGHGLNFQRCAHIAFVGVGNSWEQYYQAVRRCWRFGQKRPVHVHIFSSALEGDVLTNLKRKEAEAIAMAEALSLETREAVRAEVCGQGRTVNMYEHVAIAIPSWVRAEECTA